MKNFSFILASQSPIRKKILSDLQYDFVSIASNAPEFFHQQESVEKNAMRLALEKAKEVQKNYPQKIIIGSDSIMVDAFGNFLEKPKNRADAKKMMQQRSGKTESIVSSLAIIHGDKEFLAYEKSFMTWKKISDEEIEFLLDRNEWQGKCGGVMIEGITGLFVTKIEGSLVNIMGFPLQAFQQYLEKYYKNF